MPTEQRMPTQRLVRPTNEQRMIDAQARLISRMSEINKAAHAQIARLESKVTRAGAFYMMLQGVIAENPILQSEWSRFLSFVKLADAQEKLKLTPDNVVPQTLEAQLSEEESELLQQIIGSV